MVVTDLDDTILTNDKKVSTLTYSIFKQIKEMGIITAFATGRNLRSAKKVAHCELFDGYIAQNGAIGYFKNELIYSKPIHIDDLRAVMRNAKVHNIKVAVETCSKCYANFELNEYWKWLHDYEIVDFETVDLVAEKLFINLIDENDRQFVNSYLPSSLHHMTGLDNLALIMNREASKMNAVKAICEHLDISVKDVVAFGDEVNDIDLLMGCGIGVAVKNAVEQAKEASDEICDTNENDGVANWLIKNVIEAEGDYAVN